MSRVQVAPCDPDAHVTPVVVHPSGHGLWATGWGTCPSCGVTMVRSPSRTWAVACEECWPEVCDCL